jgi:hypothetical protein
MSKRCSARACRWWTDRRHVYRITDAHETDTTFSDLVFILSQAGQGGG